MVVEGVEVCAASGAGRELSPLVKGVDVAIKWLLVIGLVLLVVGLVVAAVGMFSRRRHGPRIGFAWLTIKVTDIKAGNTVLSGTYRPPLPKTDTAADSQPQQPLDVGRVLLPAGTETANLRLVVTDYEWLYGSSSDYVQWNGANEVPGIPARVIDGAAVFRVEAANVSTDNAASVSVPITMALATEA